MKAIEWIVIAAGSLALTIILLFKKIRADKRWKRHHYPQRDYLPVL
ncbi:MAG: hypothetical protein WDO19_03800 [Bacteroidota bacterium]